MGRNTRNNYLTSKKTKYQIQNMEENMGFYVSSSKYSLLGSSNTTFSSSNRTVSSYSWTYEVNRYYSAVQYCTHKSTLSVKKNLNTHGSLAMPLFFIQKWVARFAFPTQNFKREKRKATCWRMTSQPEVCMMQKLPWKWHVLATFSTHGTSASSHSMSRPINPLFYEPWIP